MEFFEVLAQSGTIDILLTLHSKGNCRYSELESIVGNPRSTSKRLKALVELELINRRILADKYRSVEYSLTPLGKKLADHLDAIRELEQGRH